MNEQAIGSERRIEIIFVCFNPLLQMMCGEKIHTIPRWSDGVLEYSSDGFRNLCFIALFFELPITPLLHYSNFFSFSHSLTTPSVIAHHMLNPFCSARKTFT